MKKKIFLSGGSGFIGRNVIEALSTKYDIVAPTHKQLNLLDFNSVLTYFKKYGPFNFVLHGAISGGNRMAGDSAEMAFNSQRMFFNLAQCEKLFSRFFYLGSGIEFGKERPIINITESKFGDLVPQSNWGLYKYVCSKYAQKNNKFVNLRLFGVFGKYEDCRIRFISNAICRNIFDMPIVINKNIVMDYLYVDDFVSVLDILLTKKVKLNVYNITNGYPLDLISIAKRINSLGEKKVKIIVRNKGLSNQYTGSNARLLREFKEIRFTKMNNAIEKLYDWYLSRKTQIKKEDLDDNFF